MIFVLNCTPIYCSLNSSVGQVCKGGRDCMFAWSSCSLVESIPVKCATVAVDAQSGPHLLQSHWRPARCVCSKWPVFNRKSLELLCELMWAIFISIRLLRFVIVCSTASGSGRGVEPEWVATRSGKAGRKVEPEEPANNCNLEAIKWQNWWDILRLIALSRHWPVSLSLLTPRALRRLPLASVGLQADTALPILLLQFAT